MIPNILAQIAKSVAVRLKARQEQLSEDELRSRIPHARRPHDFEAAFRQPGIHTIAEVKFRSPALGVLDTSGAELALEIADSYLRGGATAISVLTEEDHFLGSPDYLKAIREAFPQARLLMKDFVLGEYQVMEALINGADAVLLIVALLGPEQTRDLIQFAKTLGLSALVEVHDEAELKQALQAGASLIGVNNRNLKTLEVSLENSHRMAKNRVEGKIFISESGITTSAEIKALFRAGYQGFLVGSILMTSKDPGEQLQNLIAGAE
ncbi:MAG: indole-3-glycerol phosphate synthase TrpC [Bdellovibrionales bacterium]|nr:indole-3-glycerol phosphate synthase TrpC [Oligoflexia bacterium]